MKRIQYFSVTFLLLFSIIFSACTERDPESYVLQGTLENFKGDSLFIQLPVDGKFFYQVKNIKVPVDSLTGYFKAEITEEVIGYALIPHNKSRSSLRTWITPGKTDSVFVDFEERDTFMAYGDLAEAVNLLNGFERIGYFHAFGGPDEKYQKDSVAQNVYDLLMSKIDDEKIEIDALLSDKKIDKGFAEAMKVESEFHWKSVFASAAYRHYYFKVELKRDSPYNDNWKNLYLNMMENTDFQAPMALSSNYYRTLASDFLGLYPMLDGNKFEADTTISREQQSTAYFMNRFADIKQKFEGEHHELMWAYELNYAAIQKQYQRVLIALHDEFNTDFPESSFDARLTELVDPVRSYHMQLERPMSDNIILIENANEFTDWEQIIEPYKGELLYIDMWATWCGPCKAEFEFKEGLYDFVADKPIKLIYLSSDRDNMEDKWKEMVNFYGLEGINLRISQDLNWKIWKEQFGMTYSSIPRYIIVDQEGKIVVPDAVRPSEGKKLYDQLAKYL